MASVDAIAAECFPETTFSTAEEIARPWVRAWTASLEAERLVGFLVAWHVADELHVLHVATIGAARRRGVGRALMEEAARYARTSHVRLLLLEVRRSNHGAVALYRQLGFSIFGVRKGYYADNGEDAVEMLLALDPTTGEALPGRDEIALEA